MTARAYSNVYTLNSHLGSAVTYWTAEGVRCYDQMLILVHFCFRILCSSAKFFKLVRKVPICTVLRSIQFREVAEKAEAHWYASIACPM